MNLNPLALWRRFRHRRAVYTWHGWAYPARWTIDVNPRPLDKE